LIADFLLFRNILLKNGHVKIGDLGAAIIIEEENNAKTQRGSPAYMSPEMIKIFIENERITSKTDIWYKQMDTVYLAKFFCRPLDLVPFFDL
jgi:serine/threonine protein kinase